MLSRKLLIALISVAALGATAYAATATYGRITYETNPPITEELVKQVKIGMPIGEVNRIIKRKPDVHIERSKDEIDFSADAWFSEDLSLHVDYMHGLLIKKEVRDDKLFPKTTLLPDLSQEMRQSDVDRLHCDHNSECQEARREMPELFE